ncbi:MAG TPA: hypothetical protein VJM11_17365 [Nevskiaceae bacterium]|nr:hypothetical protein [Nevskiaceae bacterium]
MRPSTSETLRAMRRVLAEIVVPLVHDRYALEQLHHQMQALEDLARHCHDELPQLLEANDELTGIVRDARAACSGDELLAQVLDGVRDAGDPPSRPPAFDAIERRNAALREALVQIIRAWPRRAALSPPRRAIRDRIRGHLDRHVERASR